MRRRRNTQVSQIACANNNVSPCQRVLLAIFHVDHDDAGAIESFLNEKVRYFVPDLDRVTKSNRRVKSATTGDAIDRLRADGVCGCYKLGLSGWVLFVAPVWTGGR